MRCRGVRHDAGPVREPSAIGATRWGLPRQRHGRSAPEIVDRLPSMAPRDLIGLLSQPFHGGDGPSHSTIALVWESAGAGDYLPEEGNKLDRVRYGLRRLRDGYDGPTGKLPSRPDLFRAVVEDLGGRLVDQGSIDADELDARLRDSAPSPKSSEPQAATPRAPTSDFSELFATFFQGPPQGVQRAPQQSVTPRAAPTQTIFIVHGHDSAGYRYRIAKVISDYTNAQATILHDQPNAGRTIIEKFEEHAGRAAYAIALFTADDRGGPPSTDPRPRARQNVIFELGFFFGRLGRHRTAVLIQPDVERPSDIDGLVYISLDQHEGWRLALLRELSIAEIDVSIPKK